MEERRRHSDPVADAEMALAEMRLMSLNGYRALAERWTRERSFAERVQARLRNDPNRRKPPEAGLSVPAVPPKGPSPKQGGAAAPFDFDNL